MPVLRFNVTKVPTLFKEASSNGNKIRFMFQLYRVESLVVSSTFKFISPTGRVSLWCPGQTYLLLAGKRQKPGLRRI